MKVVNRVICFGKMEVAMTCLWNGLWNGLGFPLITVARLWRRARRNRIPFLDPRLLNAHGRRDLGFDN
jgi:hypothetical protein